MWNLIKLPDLLKEIALLFTVVGLLLGIVEKVEDIDYKAKRNKLKAKECDE